MEIITLYIDGRLHYQIVERQRTLMDLGTVEDIYNKFKLLKKLEFKLGKSFIRKTI